MEKPNPFKEMESDAICPPHLKTEIVSEIDLMRNVMTVVELYIGDLFNLASALADPSKTTSSTNSQTES
ncbi:hypothetical protein [Spirosoma areae]